MTDTPSQPPGWYYAQGDPPGTQRYWDGQSWQGGPQPVPGGIADPSAAAASRLANGGARIGARVIDWIVWLVALAIIGLVIGGSSSFDLTATEAPEITARSVLAGLVGLVAVVAYETLMVSSRGATLGKMALNLKVVKEDGSAADVGAGLRRIAPYLVLSLLGQGTTALAVISFVLIIVVTIASLVMLFTDARNQTVWDKLAKTLVVNA